MVKLRPALPDLTQHFPANAFLLGPGAGHDSTRGSENIDAQTAEHARHFPAAHVHATPGPRNPLDPRDHRNVARRVLEVDTNGPAGALFGELEVGDVAFFFHDP